MMAKYYKLELVETYFQYVEAHALPENWEEKYFGDDWNMSADDSPDKIESKVTEVKKEDWFGKDEQDA